MRRNEPGRKKKERSLAEGTVWVNTRCGKQFDMVKVCKG